MMFWQRVRVRYNVFCNRQLPIIMNTITPAWYLVCTLSLNWIANDHMIDHLYGKGTRLSNVCRLVLWILSAQMMLHWIFLCKVKSNYTNTEENNRKRVEHEKAFPQFTSEGVEYEELRKVRPTLGTGNWSVVTQYTGTEVKRTAYPYWGWKPCIVCSYYKPPRCHHCPICDTCVLKRDHHCFFARQCVGLHNQRYFVVFNFWAVLLTVYFVPQFWYYITTAVWPSMRAYELFLPFTVIGYIVGQTERYTLVVIFEMYSLIYFMSLATFFLVEQLRCIDQGMTSYELDHRNETIKSQYKFRFERFACVFGRSPMWINLLIPYHWASEPTDDGLTWQSMKMD